MAKSELNEINEKILDSIRHDARKSYEQIAKEVGLSRTAIKNRIISMEKSGIIVGYDTRVRSTNINRAYIFTIDVETSPCDFLNVKNLLGESDFITELYIMTGDCHLHAVGVAENQIILQSYINKLQKQLCDAKSLSIYSVLSVCKDKDGGVEYVNNKEEKNGIF